MIQLIFITIFSDQHDEICAVRLPQHMYEVQDVSNKLNRMCLYYAKTTYFHVMYVAEGNKTSLSILLNQTQQYCSKLKFLFMLTHLPSQMCANYKLYTECHLS